MELAARLKATLFFFTTVPAGSSNPEELQGHVHQALLKAHGNYLQYYYTPRNGTVIAQTKRFIEKGDFACSLLNFIKESKFNIIVVDPQASGLSYLTINDVVANSTGVIVLPDQGGSVSLQPRPRHLNKTETKITEDFYDVLSQSDLYKLPGNFFKTLGQDKRLFNYLRGFFGKNPSPHP